MTAVIIIAIFRFFKIIKRGFLTSQREIFGLWRFKMKAYEEMDCKIS